MDQHSADKHFEEKEGKMKWVQFSGDGHQLWRDLREQLLSVMVDKGGLVLGRSVRPRIPQVCRGSQCLPKGLKHSCEDREPLAV